MTKKLSCCAIRIAPLALCVAFVSSPALADIQSGQYTYADLDGTAYFDTGYKVKANSVFRFKMAALSSTANYQNLFADYVDESTQVTRVIVNGTSATDFIVNFFCKSSGNKYANGVVSARGDPVEGVLAYDYAILNSARYELTKKEGTASTATMKIGGRGQSDQANGSLYLPSSLGQHYWPYHGTAAAAGKSASDVARDLGWDTSIWDLSGSTPVLK